MIIEIDIKAAAKELPVYQAFYMTGAYLAMNTFGENGACDALDAPFALPAGYTSREMTGDVTYRAGVFK